MAVTPEQQRAMALARARRRRAEFSPSESAAERLRRENPAEYDQQSPEWQERYGAVSGTSSLNRARAGAGKAFVDTGRGIRQLVATGDDERTAELQARQAETERLDAALMDTTAGTVGNFTGNLAIAAPTVLIPGANTVTGAALIGGGFGMAQPTTEGGQRIVNTATGTALGAGAQKLFNVAGGLIGRYVGNRRFSPGIKEAEQLREGLRNDLRAAGATDEQIEAAIRTADDELARITANPEATARSAEAKRLGVDLTPGQATRSITTQGREVSLARGTEGDEAAAIAREGFERQQGQLRDAAGRLQERFGGQVTERGRGAAITAEGIRDQSQLARQGIREAYDAAKATDAFSGPAAVRNLGEGARANLIEEGFDIGAMPAVTRRLDELTELQNFAQMAAQKGQTKAQIPLNQLEQWRKRINAAIGKNADTPEDAALIGLKREYDTWIQNQLDNDLLSGAPEALELWKNARASRARYGELFESERAIRDIVRKNPTPEEVKNWLVGASAVGAKAQAGRIAENVAEIVGRNSPAWRALQEEVYADLLTNQPANGFSAQKFITAFDRWTMKNPTLVKTLFDKPDLDAIKQLRDVAELTIPLPGAVNTSNTSYALIRQLSPKVRAVAEKITPFLERIKQALSAVEARTISEGYQPTPKRLMFEQQPVGGPAAAGGMALVPTDE